MTGQLDGRTEMDASGTIRSDDVGTRFLPASSVGGGYHGFQQYDAHKLGNMTWQSSGFTLSRGSIMDPDKPDGQVLPSIPCATIALLVTFHRLSV